MLYSAPYCNPFMLDASPGVYNEAPYVVCIERLEPVEVQSFLWACALKGVLISH